MELTDVLEPVDHAVLQLDIVIQEVERVRDAEIAGDYAGYLRLSDLAALGNVLRLLPTQHVIPLHDRVPLGDRLGDLGIAPVGPKLALHIVAKEVDEGLPCLRPMQCIAHRHHLVVRQFQRDYGPPFALLGLSDVLLGLLKFDQTFYVRRRWSWRGSVESTVAALELLAAPTWARLIATDLHGNPPGKIWR